MYLKNNDLNLIQIILIIILVYSQLRQTCLSVTVISISSCNPSTLRKNIALNSVLLN